MQSYIGSEGQQLDQRSVVKLFHDRGYGIGQIIQFMEEVPANEYGYWDAQAALAWLGY